MKKCLIVSGGTAGHILPSKEIALSLINKGYDVHWLGYGELIEKIPNAQSIFYHQVLSRSVNRKVFFNIAYWKLFFHDMKVVKKLYQTYDFEFVLLTGNFITFLPGLMAFLRKVPVYLYEQNSQLGRANRLFSFFAKKIFWGLHPHRPLKEHEFFTAQPLRQSLIELELQRERYFSRDSQTYTLLVLGGSLGAHFFNTKLIEKLASSLSKTRKTWQIIHLCGQKGRVVLTQENYKKVGLKALVLGYIDDMTSLYEKSDAVIARAGAMSLSELVFLKKPSLIIPMPNSVGDHQRANAYGLMNQENIQCFEQEKLEDTQILNFLRSVENGITTLPQDNIAQLCTQD